MFRRCVLSAALAVVCLGTGCVSVSHVQTADTLGAGKFQFAIEPGSETVGAVIDDAGSAAITYPHLDLALRYGVSDRVDLGVRFGSSLLELQSKFLLTDPRNPDIAMSLAPSFMGYYFGAGGDDDDTSASISYYNLSLPLLVGFKTRGGSEFVLGPRVIGTRIGASASTDNVAVNILSVGASVGYAWRITDGFRLMPEVGVAVPVVGDINTNKTDSEALTGFGGGFVQFKLGFLFGGGRPSQQRAPEYYSQTDDEDSEDSDSQDSSEGYSNSDTY